MIIEQFVMAYKVEQDRLRALLPEGFESIRPVLRINSEIRGEEVYMEFNTPVRYEDKKGWLNIDCWKAPADKISVQRDGDSVTFLSDFLKITYVGVGVEGGCPAEKDNDGCYYMKEEFVLIPPEHILENKEFCNCSFKWKFDNNSAHGVSIGEKTKPAYPADPVIRYPKGEFTAEAFASIPCEQMLGQYKVTFERSTSGKI